MSPAEVVVLSGLSHVLSHPFMRDAFLAGTPVALASGLVGYFVVLRAQVFSVDAFSHVAFTGALGALAFGANLLAGLYGSVVVVAFALAAIGRRARPDDTVVGNVFAFVLGLGALFLTLYTTSSAGTDAVAGVNVLFGSIFGLSGAQALTDAVIASVIVVAVVTIARPLLFASVDDDIAAARRVPVRSLGLVFMVLVAVTAGAATQAVGALLLLGLVAAPAGAARRLTARPYVALVLSGAIAVGSMWAGLLIAYAAPRVIPSFAILAVATGCYVVAGLVTAGRRHGALGPGPLVRSPPRSDLPAAP